MEKKIQTPLPSEGRAVKWNIMSCHHSILVRRIPKKHTPMRGILLLIQSHFFVFSSALSHPSVILTNESNRLQGFSMQKSNELGKESKLSSCLIAFNPDRFGKAVIVSRNFSHF